MAVIYAIPGLGCNEWLYQNLKVEGHSIKVLNWPVTERHYNLKDYAGEFISQMDLTEDHYLMGVSFGGMLCVEMAQTLGHNRIILISSAKSRTELPPLIRLLKYLPFHLLLTENLHRQIAMRSRKVLGFSKDLLPEFRAMIRSLPKNHFRYCINYIVNWGREEAIKPLIHIHGDGDRLLKFRYIKNVDYIVSNGSHAMVFTRADEIGEVLAKVLRF